MASDVMVWSTKFEGYATGLWPDHVKILGNPKLFTLFLKPFWHKLGHDQYMTTSSSNPFHLKNSHFVISLNIMLSLQMIQYH